MGDIAALVADIRDDIGKFHDGNDVPLLSLEVGQLFPEFASYAKEAKPATPWCGIYCANKLAKQGIKPPTVDRYGVGYMYVDRWSDYGTPVEFGQEQPGDIAVYLGNPHHVTFVDEGGYYIGGNQSDTVTRQNYRQPDKIRRPPPPEIQVLHPPIKFTASGRGSWYSQYHDGKYDWTDRGDEPNSNPLGVPDQYQGISFYNHDTLGEWFEVQAPNGVISLEQQTDIGPGPSTGRKIDISAVAAEERFGYTTKSFPTDGIFYWRKATPPAAVAALTPKEQAVKYRALRGKEKQVMADKDADIVLPAKRGDERELLGRLLSVLQNADWERVEDVLKKGEKLAHLAAEAKRAREGKTIDNGPDALEPEPTPTPKPGAPALLGGSFDLRTGILGVLGSLAMSHFDVLGAPVGPGSTAAGALAPILTAAAAAFGIPSWVGNIVTVGLSIIKKAQQQQVK